tara:strand:- start:736 stop:1152 length:417 start_codon:yes stop_codon:yes gene_type:complete
MRGLKIFFGFIFLFIGSYLYLKFRSETLLMFKWAENLGLDFIVSSIRRSFEGLNLYQMNYFVFSAPYGLWVISFCCFIGAIWHKDSSVSAIIWRLFVPVIAISSEILQFVGFLPGTYDINDLLVLSVSTIIGLIISFL